MMALGAPDILSTDIKPSRLDLAAVLPRAGTYRVGTYNLADGFDRVAVLTNIPAPNVEATGRRVRRIPTA